jgi:hypothetical protein
MAYWGGVMDMRLMVFEKFFTIRNETMLKIIVEYIIL